MSRRMVQYGVVNASDADVGAGAPGFRATWQSKDDLRQQVMKISDVPNNGKLYFWDGQLWLRWDDPDDLPGPKDDPLRIKIVCPEVSVTDKLKKKRLPSEYADMRKKLPSASGMDLTIMRQLQGVATINDITKEPQLQHVASPLYMNYRCSAQQVPIKLLHPVFGRFEHLAENVQPSLAALDFVHTVCAQAKYYYASEEKDYQQVMRNIWKHALFHLGGVSRPSVARNSTPDLALSAPHGLAFLAEFKLGLDDQAQPQALRHFEQLWEETWPEVLNQSFAATFIIEMMGAILRIGGAAWGDSIYYEPLTPVMNLLPLWGQEAAMLRLAKQVTALLACLGDLFTEYSSPAPLAQDDRVGLYGSGIPIALHDMRRFENVSSHQAEHAALYSYADPATGQKRLAKFSGQYGTEVHAAWASVGLAPALLDVVDLDFNTFLITMEHLPEAWRVLSDLSDSELLEAKPYVLQALLRAQHVEIGMGALGAHGDMRLPNVAVLLEPNQWHTRFLDFDWAGVAGEDTYPAFMNPKITWPAGAQPFAVMQSKHDVALLQMQFDQRLN